jgi:hypothetical protein
VLRLHHLALGHGHVEGGEELGQRIDLFGRGRIVNPEQQRRFSGFKRFSRRHIGLDHELFDQLVSIEPHRGNNALDLAVVVQDQLALWQVKFERLALVTCIFRAL